MDIEIEVPEDVAEQLVAEWGNVSRRTLEALAAEAYRSDVITEAQVQNMLGFSSRWETETFLRQAQAYLNYNEADLEQDILAIRRKLSR